MCLFLIRSQYAKSIFSAHLTLENARQHLEKFCATLHCHFTKKNPEFLVNELGEEIVTAKVYLPRVLDPQFQEFSGATTWRTAKMAQRDAAFQACSKLYDAGLINEHLMPVHCEEDETVSKHMEKRTAMVEIPGTFNPWTTVARQWRQATKFYQSVVGVTSSSHLLPEMRMVLPVMLPCEIPIKIFWNAETTIILHLNPQNVSFPKDSIEPATLATRSLLSSIFTNSAKECLDYCCLFVPDIQPTPISIENWGQSVNGSVPATTIDYGSSEALANLGLVRSINMRPWACENTLWLKPRPNQDDIDVAEESIEQVEKLHIEGKVLPRRTDFLHPVANKNSISKHHTAKQCYPAEQCSVDKLPMKYAMFTLFVPSIIHTVEIFLVAHELANSILLPIGFENLELVLTAISASVAREATNYQRLEFLGDSLLKLHTSLHLSAANLYWHEGLLSAAKDKIVSNLRLTKATIETGLDKFILLDPFTGSKWKPKYNSDQIEEARKETSRNVSTKTLADVVESLIGAAGIDGGNAKIVACLKIFLPECHWKSMDEQLSLLYDSIPESRGTRSNDWLCDVESIVGHNFKKKVLLAQALSHPCNKGMTVTYQRLEFIGDSILDTIVAQALFSSPKNFPHFDMHLMRSALVNADFLAFCCMNTSMEEIRNEISQDEKGKYTTTETISRIYLWQFMKHSASWEIAEAQRDTFERYKFLRNEISTALESANTYPWSLLSRLKAPKFFSDIVESVLGAIYIDTHGSLDTCNAFLERIGLMKYLHRLLTEDGINVMHPKERLGIVADTKKVHYDTNEIGSSQGSHRQWSCTVLVDEKEVTRLEDGISKVDVETRAADEALSVLCGDVDMKDTEAEDFSCCEN